MDKAEKIPEGYRVTEAGILPVDWQVKRLSEVATELTERAGQDKYETVSISAGVGFVNQAEKFGKELSGKQYEKYIVLHQGDFSYNKGNSKTFPQGCIYRLNDRETAAVPNVFESFRIEDQDADYYEQLFLSGFLNKQLYSKINRGVRDDGLLNLTGKDFYSCMIPVPPKDEQKKIAQILAQCDTVIELKEQRIEEERKKKVWLSQKLLTPSQNHADMWKCVCLSTLCKNIIDGDWIEAKDQSDDGIRLIQTGNIGVGKYLDKPNRAKYISEETFSTLKCTEVLNGDVLVSRLPDPIGRACFIDGLQNRAITAVDCSILRFESLTMAKLFVQIASTNKYFNEIYNLAGGSTRTRIARKELEKLRITIPVSKDYQEKILQILFEQDGLIDALVNEVDLLKSKKQAVMKLLLTGIVRVKL